jgi:hypothetical protein
MYVKNTGKLFQIEQVAGPKALELPKRAYANKGQPQGYLTGNHNHALKQQRLGGVSKYYEPYLDLNNFEIVEYELVLVTKHKHPLVE